VTPELYLIVEAWIGAFSLLAFVSMGVDRAAARLRRKRIAEKTLWLEAIVGGFPGIMLGGVVFRHKVAKGSFWVPVIVALLLWFAIFYALYLHLE
jgi:uncharacterized membrane protein YsdA (DUF1294 family)